MPICKYNLEVKSYQELSVPIQSIILKAKNQKETIQLYLLHNNDTQTEIRKISVLCTGQDMDNIQGYNQEVYRQSDLHYIDTVLMKNGDVVLHIFEIITT